MYKVRELRHLGVVALSIIAGQLVLVQNSDAETLSEALSSAYSTNPGLNADRARQRATDEQLPQAVSGFRPVIGAYSDVGRDRTRNNSVSPRVNDDTSRVGVTITQPLFNGFRTVNGVRQAKEDIKAGREQLTNTEQNTLLAAASAYLAVLRDQRINQLNKQNIGAVREQLEGTRARYRGGELTKTDVQQAETRLSRAVADQQVIIGNLATSRATYKQVIGNEPQNLVRPPSLRPLLPESEQAALEIAKLNNPAIQSARHAAKAAQFAVDVTGGEMLPTVSLQGDLYREYDELGYRGGDVDGASVQLRLDVPIYQAGAVVSRLRQSKATRSQRDLELIVSERQVTESVAAAWAGLQAARAQIASRKAQVVSARLAESGVARQAKAGVRTTMDVLDALQELIDAQISLESAIHDEAVAGYSLLAAMGWLTADKLALHAERYDATRNLVRLRTGAFDFLQFK